MIENIEIKGIEDCAPYTVTWEATGQVVFSYEPTGDKATVIVNGPGVVKAVIVGLDGECTKTIEHSFGIDDVVSDCEVKGAWRVEDGVLTFTINKMDSVSIASGSPVYDSSINGQGVDGQSHTYSWNNYDPNSDYRLKLFSQCGVLEVVLAAGIGGNNGVLNVIGV